MISGRSKDAPSQQIQPAFIADQEEEERKEEPREAGCQASALV